MMLNGFTQAKTWGKLYLPRPAIAKIVLGRHLSCPKSREIWREPRKRYLTSFQLGFPTYLKHAWLGSEAKTW